MKKAKRLLAVLLMIALVMAFAVPAMAADIGSITITTKDTDAHTFTAYQIFKGTLSSEGTLVDVQWSDSFTVDESLWNALSNISINKTESVIRPFDQLGTQDNPPKTAASVASILAEEDDPKLVEEFLKVITAKDNGVYKYLGNQGKNLTDVADKAGTYFADQLEIGYYVVIDSTEKNKSDMILRVVGDVHVEAKQNLPSVDKTAGKEDVSDNANYSVGDKIAYTLKGTMVNFTTERDATYTYKFTDTMDAALDLVYTPSTADNAQVDGGVRVMLGEGEGAKDITNKFTIKYVTNDAGKHVLTLESDSLKTVDGINTDSVIFVTYEATLNSNFEGQVGNKVKLETSVDSDGTSTPEKEELVYPLTMEVTKIDGANNGLKLPNAKFALYRLKDSNTREYASVGTNQTVTGWSELDANGTITRAMTLTTDENGKITVKGLGAGTYYLEELEAPTGYNKLTDPIMVEIMATAQKSNNGGIELAALSYSINGGNATDGNTTTGTVSFNVENNKGAQLPSTGGIGTTIFYVIGGILVVGAVVLLVTRKRMNAE